MSEDDRERDDERPRPRVVDRRISARSDEESPAPAPSPPEVSDEPTSSEAPPDEAGPPPAEVWTPEREEQARQIAEEIAATPSIEWMVSVAATLANVAGAKLEGGDVADARLPIDALA